MERSIFLQDMKALKLLLESARSILHDSQETGSCQKDRERNERETEKGLEILEQWIDETAAYSAELSQGNLSGSQPPEDNILCEDLKQLHDSLKQLTRQARQAAEGDYSQQVTYPGELAEAFHAMTVQMKELEDELKAKREEIKNQTDLVDSYDELLLELTRKRKEWILVVDVDNKGIIYCNKRKAGKSTVEDEGFCDICEKRLPFRNRILNWEDEGQDHVWEITDCDHRSYSITTFPLEWQKRHAYAHILMDVTDEKLKTRTLKDKAYHDGLTGLYNRIYFEEYMEQIFEEKADVILGYLDLDCLKTVNDIYGHEEGDGYIRRFVSTVRKHFRTSDVFARIGGDEFCLVLDGIEKKIAEEKLELAMKEFQSYNDKEYVHGFSYGITGIVGETETRTLSQIIKEVDAAMYQCKRKNKELYKKLQEGDKE